MNTTSQTDIELHRIYHAVALDRETSHCETGLDSYVDTHTTASPHTFQQSWVGGGGQRQNSHYYTPYGKCDKTISIQIRLRYVTIVKCIVQ